jgi:hypothetical protein
MEGNVKVREIIILLLQFDIYVSLWLKLRQEKKPNKKPSNKSYYKKIAIKSKTAKHYKKTIYKKNIKN